MELEQGAYFGGEIASSGHKNEMKNLNIKMRSPRKNHNVALSDYEKGKKKDVSQGENLSQAPKDGGFNLPIIEYQEKSTILVEDSKPINVGTTKAPKVTYHATSLDPKERFNLLEFICERKIKFTWKYVDIPGLDPFLVVHHLKVFPTMKLVK